MYLSKKLILTLKPNDVHLISRTSIHVLIKRIMIDQIFLTFTLTRPKIHECSFGMY